MTATPRPWRVGVDGDVYAVETNRRIAAHVAHGGSEREDADSMSLIVRAVNAHAGLLYACKGLLKSLESPDALNEHYMQLAREAIAEAEQKP